MSHEHFYQKNNVIVSYLPISFRHFKYNLVWVENWSSREFQFIKRHIEDHDWVENVFFNPCMGDSHPFYTIVGDRDYYNNCEFAYISCKIVVLDKIYDGYVYLVSKNIKSINVFFNTSSKSLGTSFYFNDSEFKSKLISKFAKLKIENFTSIEIFFNAKIKISKLDKNKFVFINNWSLKIDGFNIVDSNG